MNKQNVLILLCGIWSLGLGFRYSVELLASDGWIHVPKYPGYGVNIWFDFLPLSIFGLATTIILIKRTFKEMKEK